jgi:hypothetical protein
MRLKKTHKSFTLYRKETQAGPVWYARFWDETTKYHAATRSTGIPVEGKKQRRYEAEEAARKMLPQIQFAPPPEVKTFTQYLEEFWTPDSPYVNVSSIVWKYCF